MKPIPMSCIAAYMLVNGKVAETDFVHRIFFEGEAVDLSDPITVEDYPSMLPSEEYRSLREVIDGCWDSAPWGGPSHEWVYQDTPVSQSKWDWWGKQDAAVLNTAVKKVLERSANPWTFGLDARGFHRFASAKDRAALLAMTDEERTALLGEWEKEDFDAFAFDPPRQVTAEEAKQIAEVKALGEKDCPPSEALSSTEVEMASPFQEENEMEFRQETEENGLLLAVRNTISYHTGNTVLVLDHPILEGVKYLTFRLAGDDNLVIIEDRMPHLCDIIEPVLFIHPSNYPNDLVRVVGFEEIFYLLCYMLERDATWEGTKQRCIKLGETE